MLKPLEFIELAASLVRLNRKIEICEYFVCTAMGPIPM